MSKTTYWQNLKLRCLKTIAEFAKHIAGKLEYKYYCYSSSLFLKAVASDGKTAEDVTRELYERAGITNKRVGVVE